MGGIKSSVSVALLGPLVSVYNLLVCGSGGREIHHDAERFARANCLAASNDEFDDQFSEKVGLLGAHVHVMAFGRRFAATDFYSLFSLNGFGLN
jgi:hypothetical protein